MKNTRISLILISTLLVAAPSAFAGEAPGHSIQASRQGSQAVAHSAVGAAKLTSGVIAVPLMAVGEIGKAAGSVGETLWDEASTPLPISDETVTAGPPPSIPFSKNLEPNPPTSEEGK